jgi:hypothetical protein
MPASPQAQAAAGSRPRVVLMCHAESVLNRVGIATWLASFAELAGMVIIAEKKDATLRRVKSEIRRVGFFRFLDVLAFRVYYALFLAGTDSRWMRDRLARLAASYPDARPDPEILQTSDPNSAEVVAFLRRLAPDMMVARCKRILREEVFSVPSSGTFVLHPGICPEYRNAHGAYWALATGDLPNVGLTLLRIDKGIDTGPVYGYYHYDFDEVRESHIMIMTQLALENLDALRDTLLAARAGSAVPIDTRGRSSAVWGQPWLTGYLRWKRDAKRRNRARANARIS